MFDLGFSKISNQFSEDFEGTDMRGPGVLAAAATGDAAFVEEKPNVYRNGVKRLFDVLFVLAVAPIALPILLIAAMIVSIDGGMPFYWSERVGRGGRVYRMMKLRSMVRGADKRLNAYLEQNPAAAQEWQATQKLKDDPRITRFGRLLRKTSMDELPQLWNVLTGDMSVVGPRPFLPEQKHLYPGVAYYALRPGITGFWQVSERNEVEFIERAKYDRAYYKHMSLKTDLVVILRTVAVVFRCTGY